MTIKRRDFQKASALIHEFLLKLSEDAECAELRDALNLALLHMQRYYRLLRSRLQTTNGDHNGGSQLSQSLRGLSPMTPFRDQPDKFQWKWTNLESPKTTNTLPVDLRKKCSTLPVVILAAKQGDNAMLMSLIEKDADCIFEVDALERNALMYAVHHGHLDTVQLLCQHATDVNATAADGSGAVHRACHDGQHEALQILLEYGADLEIQDHMGRAPIHWACANPNRDCLKLLIENGANVNVRDNDGLSPSMWACRMDHIEHFELLSQVENQVIEEEDGLERDNNGRTWMHWSVRRTDPHECLKTLLTEDSACIRDKDGKTVIHTAAELGSLPAAKVILEIAGPSCLEHRDDQSRSPLALATMGGHGEVVNFFLNNGAHIPSVDNFGATAWDYACARQLHYCMLIIASYIRQQARKQEGVATSSGAEDSGREGIMGKLVNGGHMPDPEGLGINQLQINSDDPQPLHYASQPTPPPRPPQQPSTPRTPRAPHGVRTPRGRNVVPATPRGDAQSAQLPVPSTPRGFSAKRSPSTPIEMREEEMLFERNERDSSAGSTSKRMRSEENSPNREHMSVMSVESFNEPAVESRQSSGHMTSRTRPRMEPAEDEPELQSNSHYIDAEEGHGEEQESVSIDAMDVSDFDAEADDEEGEGGLNHHGAELHHPNPGVTRSPPPRPPHHPRPHPLSPAQSSSQGTQPFQYDSHPPQPPPPSPHAHNQLSDHGLHQQQHQPRSLYQWSSQQPHHSAEGYAHPKSPTSPPYHHPQPPHQQQTRQPQYEPGPDDYVDNPPSSEVEDEKDDPHPVPSPRVRTSAQRNQRPPSGGMASQPRPVLPPAHLTPLSQPSSAAQRKKKKKKKRERQPSEQLGELQGPLGPPQSGRGYTDPVQPPHPGPLVHPPPRQMRDPSPPRPSAPPDGYHLKPPMKKNPPPPSAESEQSFALDNSLRATRPSKPPSSLTPSLPQASPRGHSVPHKPPPSPPAQKTVRNQDFAESANSRKSQVQEQRSGGQRSKSAGRADPHQKFPGPIANGPVHSRNNPQNGPITASRSSSASPQLTPRRPPSPLSKTKSNNQPPWSPRGQQLPNGQLPPPAHPRRY